MNEDIIAGCLLLGPSMAEGGNMKAQRDAIVLKVAVKHGIATSIDELTKIADEGLQTFVAHRLKLSGAQIQTVEQVCLHFRKYHECDCV